MAAGVVRTLITNQGVVTSGTAGVLLSGDYASGSITLNTLEPVFSGLILGVQMSGVWSTLTLASGLKISGGALYLG